MKILILRFSSFGDIVQALDVPTALRERFPGTAIHWAVRSDFREVVALHPHVDRIWTLDRQKGWRGLWKLATELRKEGFTHLYDAHNNLRSWILRLLLMPPHLVRRSKNRWKRFLLFKFRKNLFPWPFIGRKSFLAPLSKWGVSEALFQSPFPQLALPFEAPQKYVVLIPATAWAKKNWPRSHWVELIGLLQDQKLVVLGGPSDQFIDEIVTEAKHPSLLNLRGRLSLIESCAVVAGAKAVISADTGLMHVADQLGRPTLALIGPSAFGYPGSKSSRTLEVQLDCKPCSKDGRGPCQNQTYQKCMIDIRPTDVARFLREMNP